jgi:hypothetical protein
MMLARRSIFAHSLRHSGEHACCFSRPLVNVAEHILQTCEYLGLPLTPRDRSWHGLHRFARGPRLPARAISQKQSTHLECRGPLFLRAIFSGFCAAHSLAFLQACFFLQPLQRFVGGPLREVF